MNRVFFASLSVLVVGCSCGRSGSSSDGGTDAASDAATEDSATRDAATSDAAPPGCGDGRLDDDEACDGPLFRDDLTCGALGLPAGTLACSDRCEVDTSGCYVCGDGVCSDAETSASCAEDCGVVSIAAGRTHTCAVLADGSLWCWGARDGHRMGGATDTRVPIRVPGHDNVVQVAAGDHHTCFVDREQKVWCFGANGFGEVGVTPSAEVFPPVQVATGSQVETGANHSCAIDPADGGVSCWGRGDYGQRGDGTFSMRVGAPTDVVEDAATAPALVLALGAHASCAVQDPSVLRRWGDNSRRWMDPLGDWKNTPWTIAPRSQPGMPPRPYDVSSVALGVSHLCLNVDSGGADERLVCVGSNAYGQLGAPPSPDELRGVAHAGRWEPLSAGFAHTCARDPAGRLRCWGDNYFGQLGDGTFESRPAPAPVEGIEQVRAIASGRDHVCAILPDQTARCWGRNSEGQLGSGSMERAHATPVVPVGLGERS